MINKGTRSVDVLLLLEGTFPYVRGGVSAWVDHLIRGCSDLRFGVIFLGSARQDYRGTPYALPANVEYYAEYFLFDAPARTTGGRRTTGAAQLDAVRSGHAQMRQCIAGADAPLDLSRCSANFHITHEAFLQGRAAWDYLLECYARIPDQPPFVDYFWTVRGMHAPLWVLQAAVERAPRARVLHSPSTGYAGYLAAVLSDRWARPLIISEHGIYTKERRLDMMRASWIHEDDEFLQRPGRVHHLRHLWIDFFELLGRVSYRQAWRVVNLYAGMAAAQISDGADPDKLTTIPNGVAVERFVPCRRSFPERRNIVALVGRVVPIKDIKTFIRAAAHLRADGPAPTFWIVGPTEEDEQYHEECRVLVEHLGLAERVRFRGFQSVAEVLAEVRLTVLSSISEALPLSVLESFAAGVPVVTTDVGCCRELLYGAPGACDAQAAGRIVPIADPHALAGAVETLLGDEALWARCSGNAIARVEALYRDTQMLAHYRHLYREALGV